MVYRTCFVQNRTRHEKKRDIERVLGRNLLLYAAAKERGICLPENVSVKRGEHGKPYLKDYPELLFNISHTEGSIWLVLDKDEVGIDAEHIKPIKESLVGKVLSSEEQKQYRLCPPKDRESLFFRFWTLKESFLKALGIGIRVPLPSVSFSFSQCPADMTPFISCHQVLSDETWYFSQLQIGQEMISLCSKNENSLEWLRQYEEIRETEDAVFAICCRQSVAKKKFWNPG